MTVWVSRQGLFFELHAHLRPTAIERIITPTINFVIVLMSHLRHFPERPLPPLYY